MIKIEHLTKKYGERYAINDVSFTVERGEIVGFLGPNGAGKTTTMSIITGYLSSTSGRAEIDGMDILEHPTEVKKKIGYLPEVPPLYVDMTVKEYLEFIYDLKCCKLGKKEHIGKICETVKISDAMNRVIRNLSKGYRQRVGIAGALVGNPEVIIFDEPTNGLDPKQIIDIRNLIKDLGRDHTVILSTHILSEVKSICDRIIIISNGKIVADRKTDELEDAIKGNRRILIRIDGPRTSVPNAIKRITGVASVNVAVEYEDGSCSYLVESMGNIDVRKPIFSMLAQNGWPILSLEPVGATIENVFLSAIGGEV